MQALDSLAARAALRNIIHVYTDIDGTLLAPGGRLLADHRGAPSLGLAEALVRLKQAGVEVVIASGRDTSSCAETMRLLDLGQFIGEMGCVVQHGYGAAARKHYNLGEWAAGPFHQGSGSTDQGRGRADQGSGQAVPATPYEAILASDALALLLDRFEGRLERLSFGVSRREVTLLLRGNVDTAPGGEAEELLSQCALPLQLLDNGIISPKALGSLEVGEVHVYHLMPRGTGKGEAVAADMREKGLEPQQCLAIGDAATDVAMGAYTGCFVLARDGRKRAPEALAERTVAHPENLFATALPTADGWVEFAHALLDAKSR